jgi:hypothetical protein
MRIQSALTATAIAGILVLGADYTTFAATGDSLLIGKTNTANNTTTLTGTGTSAVLTLSTTRPLSQPPLDVNSAIKVPQLNVDMVDGKNAADLGVRVMTYPTSIGTTGTAFTFATPQVPAGSYLVNYDGIVNGDANSHATCFAQSTGPTQHFAALGTDSDGAGLYGLSGSGFVTLLAAQPVSVDCTFATTQTLQSDADSLFRITLTQVDVVTSSGAAPTP